jgi:hypothetical protein
MRGGSIMWLRGRLKGYLGLLAGVLLLLIVGGVAYADVIYEPDDDFYKQHSTKCDYIHRSYTANRKSGSINLWKSPTSHKVITALENGTTLNVSFTYTDNHGKTWGIVELFKDDNPTEKLYSGWCKMDDLLIIYDTIAFCEDHQNEFKDYNGEFDGYTPENKIILWTYPGSGVERGKLDEINQFQGFVYTYTDAEGRQWGYLLYKEGNEWNKGKIAKNWGAGSWICLSDPENEDIPVIKYPQPTMIPPSGQKPSSDAADTSNVSDASDTRLFLTMILAVVVLVAFTAVLIHIFWKKNEKPKK